MLEKMLARLLALPILGTWRVRWVASAPASLEEEEIWPDLLWRLAALLRAGLGLPAAFQKLAADQQALLTDLAQEAGASGRGGGEPREKSGSSLDLGPRAQAAYLLAQQNMGDFLGACARQASLGEPLWQVCRQSLGQSWRPSILSQLPSLEACLLVAQRSGAPLAQILETYARFLEGQIDAGQLRETALSGPASSGRIMASLPLVGLGLGILMGTEPLGFLLGSWPGALLTCLGAGLAFAGYRWTRNLTRQAERGLL